MSQPQQVLSRAARAIQALFSSSALPAGARREWQDSRTGLLNQEALAELGEPLLHRASLRGEALSLLLFEFEDLAELEVLYGARARRDMLEIIGRRLRRLAGRRGLALRLARSSFCVMLPGATREAALKHVTSKLGNPCSFELESERDELVLLPRLSVVCATEHTDSVDLLLQQCRWGSQRRTVSAFRPAAKGPVPASTAVQPRPLPAFDLPDPSPAAGTWQPCPATIPVPLPKMARQ